MGKMCRILRRYRKNNKKLGTHRRTNNSYKTHVADEPRLITLRRKLVKRL